MYCLLELDRTASASEIKKAWRKVSLKHHPDKVAQRGRAVTAEETAFFARLKEAHTILSDPHRRSLYDAYGEQGLRWIETPSEIDPKLALANFTNSSTADRARVVAAFAVLTTIVLLFPLLVCLKLDGG